MDKRKLKIYFQTKTDFLDDFLPKGSLCPGQTKVSGDHKRETTNEVCRFSSQIISNYGKSSSKCKNKLPVSVSDGPCPTENRGFLDTGFSSSFFSELSCSDSS